MNALTTIDFRGDTLFALEDGEIAYVAVKPICDTLGIAWNKQWLRLKRDAILSEGMTMMVIPSLGGPQETTLLRLDLVNGWLFTIDESRVKDEETRQRVLVYKRECYKALYDHFHPARQPQSETPQYLATMTEQRHALDLVREARMNFGPARARRMWHELGLPAVPEAPEPVSADQCLQTLLDHITENGPIASLIDEGRADLLLPLGIRLEENGFYVANSHPAILRILRDWPRFWRLLAKLPGSEAIGAMNFSGKTHRAIFIARPLRH